MSDWFCQLLEIQLCLAQVQDPTQFGESGLVSDGVPIRVKRFQVQIH